MSISVFEKIRQRVTGAGSADGPRPDVAPAAPRVPLKVRASKMSAALSHVTVIGLGAIALHTRPDLVTALIAPSGPKALPLETARPATALATAKRVPLQSVQVIRSPVEALTNDPATEPAQQVQAPLQAMVAPVKRVLPPTAIAATTAAPHEIESATAPTEKQLKALPLTVARAVVLPEARLVLAASAPIAVLPALPMSERGRDVIRDTHRMRTARVREREVTALAAAATAPPATVTPANKSVAAAVAPPLVKWAAMTPEQRAEANTPVKKSTPYTVAVTWTEVQIAAARAECGKLLKSADIVTSNAEPVKEGACGAPAPVNVSSVGNPKVQLHPSSMMTCPMAAALDKWMTSKVQPAATASFGSPVARLISASSYSCRNRYGSANTPLSEHALVNALDLAGFVLADGRTIRVKQDWGPVARDAAKKPIANNDIPIPDNKDATVKIAIAVAAPGKTGLSMLGGASLAKKTSLKTETNDKAKPATSSDDTGKAGKSKTAKSAAPAAAGEAADDKKADGKKGRSATPASATPAKDAAPVKDMTVARREFLHRVHEGACDVFGTVLGPEANDAHRDHFHLDMKARRHRAYCQ